MRLAKRFDEGLPWECTDIITDSVIFISKLQSTLKFFSNSALRSVVLFCPLLVLHVPCSSLNWSAIISLISLSFPFLLAPGAITVTLWFLWPPEDHSPHCIRLCRKHPCWPVSLLQSKQFSLTKPTLKNVNLMGVCFQVWSHRHTHRHTQTQTHTQTNTNTQTTHTLVLWWQLSHRANSLQEGMKQAELNECDEPDGMNSFRLHLRPLREHWKTRNTEGKTGWEKNTRKKTESPTKYAHGGWILADLN